jgi:hypothetical protein
MRYIACKFLVSNKMFIYVSDAFQWEERLRRVLGADMHERWLLY